MHKSILCFAVTLFIAGAPAAQDGEASGSGVAVGGSIETDDRVFTKSDAPLARQEYRLTITAQGKFGDNAQIYAETWMRAVGVPEIEQDPSLSLRQAYFDIFGLAGNHVDVRIGRQRIAWGTGDKMNPTDNLNPDDLEDLYDFGRHLGSDAVKASVYAGPVTFTAVGIPYFTKAVLPAGVYRAALMPVPEGTAIKEVMPAATLKDGGSFGLRAAGRALNADLSLSYYHGRDDLPLGVGSVTVTTQRYDTVELRYPRYQALGADAAGQVLGIGVRGEMAVFMTEKIENRLTAPAALMPFLPDPGTALDDKPYVKWVVGLDYTFPVNIYANVQWVHGFIHERGAALEDYVLMNADWTLLNGKLTVSPLGIGLEIKDFNDPSNSYAVFGEPKLAWKPVDNAELTVGGHIIKGKTGTTFGALDDRDDIFVKSKFSF